MLSKKQLLKIEGGSVSVTGTLISSIIDVANLVIDLGRSIGTSIRKMAFPSSC